MTILGAYETPLVFGLVVLGPALLPRIAAAFRQSPRAAGRPAERLPVSAKAGLAAHTLLVVYTIVFPPYDVFLSRSLQLTAPLTDQPTPIAHKLSTLAQRLLYARFGHAAVIGCSWCSTWEDYMLVTLPGLLKWYIFEAVVVGALGWSVYRRGMRTACAMVLIACALAEVGALVFWEIRVVDGDAIHLSTNLHIIRSIVLLGIPALYLYLPLSTQPLQSQAEALETLLNPLSNTLQTLRLHSVASSALARNPAFRPEPERSALDDVHVQNALRAAEVDVAAIRARAAGWVNEGWGIGS